MKWVYEKYVMLLPIWVGCWKMSTNLTNEGSKERRKAISQQREHGEARDGHIYGSGKTIWKGSLQSAVNIKNYKLT